MAEAKAGKLICLDYGEYSDYGVLGFFVVLQDFDPVKELKEFLDKNPEQKKDYSFEKDKYLAFLLSKGFLLEIEYNSLYLGSYSEDNIELK